MDRNGRKVRIGQVVSDKMDKTIVVQWKPKSGILFTENRKNQQKYKAHDENNEARVGDMIKMMETRPCPKTKRWRLVEIVEKAPIV